MNPICPKTQRLCLICDFPCAAPRINPAATAMPEEEPFGGILKTITAITETVSATTNVVDNATITITAKL